MSWRKPQEDLVQLLHDVIPEHTFPTPMRPLPEQFLKAAVAQRRL